MQNQVAECFYIQWEQVLNIYHRTKVFSVAIWNTLTFSESLLGSFSCTQRGSMFEGTSFYSVQIVNITKRYWYHHYSSAYHDFQCASEPLAHLKLKCKPKVDLLGGLIYRFYFQVQTTVEK